MSIAELELRFKVLLDANRVRQREIEHATPEQRAYWEGKISAYLYALTQLAKLRGKEGT